MATLITTTTTVLEMLVSRISAHYNNDESRLLPRKISHWIPWYSLKKMVAHC
jgi:hypothetical protein